MVTIKSNSKPESIQVKDMKLIKKDEYLEFIKTNNSVRIGNINVKLNKKWNIKKYVPDNYKPEEWTVWSFPDRGDWATHLGNYRGNWSPYIPRNLIDKFTKPGDLVLDPMVGSGTTLVECKLTNRNCIGVDINLNALMVSFNRLDFRYNPLDESYSEPKIELYEGDARNLNLLNDNSVDLIATHPPYAGIISYSMASIDGDLSSLKIENYIGEMKKIAKEFFRVLKPGKYCAILIGDTRKHRHYIPINVAILTVFLEAGFVLKEDIIKIQHNTKTTREKWKGSNYDFYKIAHEHLYIFRKLLPDEKLRDFKYSTKWW
jgi:DNA modification methylase